ncbi:MAG: HD domain-containing protein [Acidobacteriia bacterium]|nr:HD domain-containing protein [Terriglobia bacterium]
MTKLFHEIRDPIHVFIHLNWYEKMVLDSRPFQRLRNITQLALTYLLYPGATHKRFEHSLGVMELAGRVFEVITKPANVTDEVRELLPDLGNPDALSYWKQVLRMAALCHDVGHLPFSHAAEDELLPKGWSHERLSRLLIESDEMRTIWKSMVPPLEPEHIVKLAVGARKAKDLRFSKWEAILSEIIVGDAFGVDRIDYLLRDSHHTGVGYGKFDHYRLVDELRILPSFDGSTEPALGINGGGIYSAEALALARYFMFSQVYYHSIRLIYDHHLKDFLSVWLSRDSLLSEGTFPTDVEGHLRITDDEVNAAMRLAASAPNLRGHRPASCIMRHSHFKVLYEKNPQDAKVHSDPGAAIANAAEIEFGTEAIRYSKPRVKNVAPDFPVRGRDGRIQPAISASETLSKLQPTSQEYVFVDPQLRAKAKSWLNNNQDTILAKAQREEQEDEKHEADPKIRPTHPAEP